MNAPKYNQCLIETGEGVLTPAPLVLAEQLPHDQVWLLNRDPMHTDALDLYFQQASATLELGLCSPELASRQAALHDAKSIFTEIHAQNNTYKHRAGVFLDFMPAYSRRAQKNSCAPELYRRLYRRLGQRILQLPFDGSSNALGNFYEATYLGTCASTGDPDYIAFPSSVREEASSPKSANYNHDTYGIRATKLPQQIKSTMRGGSKELRKYEPEICMVRIRDLLFKSAVAAYGAERWQSTRHVRPSEHASIRMPLPSKLQLFRLTGELMVAEAKQETLPEQDAAYLNTLRANICNRVDSLWKASRLSRE